jgi:hypothetical protein
MVAAAFSKSKQRGERNMVKRSIVLLVMCCLAVGCISDGSKRYYDFTSPEAIIDAKDMVIGARLIGGPMLKKKEAAALGIKGAGPFTLTLYVISRTGFYRSARIADIQLVSADHRRVPIPDSIRHVAVRFEEHMARYWAVLTIKDLNLAYEPQVLTAMIEITTQANSTISQTIEFPFEPTYGKKKADDALTRTMNR